MNKYELEEGVGRKKGIGGQMGAKVRRRVDSKGNGAEGAKRGGAEKGRERVARDVEGAGDTERAGPGQKGRGLGHTARGFSASESHTQTLGALQNGTWTVRAGRTPEVPLHSTLPPDLELRRPKEMKRRAPGDETERSSLCRQRCCHSPPWPGTATAPTDHSPWGPLTACPDRRRDQGRFVSPLVPPCNDRMKYVCPAKGRGRNFIFQMHEAE